MGRSAKLIPLIATVVALALMGLLWSLKSAVRLDVANPLPRPVLVKVDDSTPMQVDTESTGSMKVSGTGAHLIEVTDLTGAHVETVVAVLRGNFRINVYNVLGLAPVITQQITYSKYSNNLEPQVAVYCGTRLIDLGDVDYEWVDPPRSVSLGKGSSQVTKLHLGLAKGGMQTCAGYAADKPIALELAEYESQADQPQSDRWGSLAGLGETGRAAALVRQALAQSPRAVNAHRTLQYFYAHSGREDSLRPEYEALLAAATKDAELDEARYLSARIAPLEQHEALLRSALERSPQSFWLQWALSQDALTHGRDAEALTLLEKVAASAPPEMNEPVVRSYATALVRAGKARLALAKLDGYGMPANAGPDISALLMWQAVGKAAGVVRPLPDTMGEYQKAWLAAFDAMSKGEAVTPVKTNDGRPERELLTKSRELSIQALLDPAKALTQVKAIAPGVLRWVGSWQRLLLLTEAWRVGDLEAASRLETTRPMDWPPLDEVRAFVINGAQGSLEAHCDDLTFSVLWFARSRWAQDPAAARAALKQAQRLDPPGGYASIAMAHWGAPTPTVRAADAWEYAAR